MADFSSLIINVTSITNLWVRLILVSSFVGLLKLSGHLKYVNVCNRFSNKVLQNVNIIVHKHISCNRHVQVFVQSKYFLSTLNHSFHCLFRCVKKGKGFYHQIYKFRWFCPRTYFHLISQSFDNFSQKWIRHAISTQDQSHW